VNQPMVSYVMAAYNAERYIVESLRSILQQSRPVDEIVVVDDGSTDATAAIVKSLAGPIHYVYQNNGGQSAARNRGVSESHGDFIGFLDGDDLIHPRKIERQLARFVERPELMLSDGHAQNFWSPEVPEAARQLTGWQKLTHSYKPWPGFIGTWLFRRAVWDAVGGFDVDRTFAEDSDWHDRVLDTQMPVETMPAVLARRRLHLHNLTRNNYEDHIDGLQRFYKERMARQRARRQTSSNS